ncbi:MAG: N-acetylmuramic acid 6-phosphate etherase [Clostridia bacterium]|nr:N-acetylmuramic acid 6-phosphate etherase [Clostridia bacterium]
MTQLNHIDTEQINPRTKTIDSLDSLGIATLINQEDQLVASAVEKELPCIAQAVDKICEALQRGGRLIYCGAGTSGRLGVLDAVECPPTYGVVPGLVLGLIAGGPSAFMQAVEGAEDNYAMGGVDLEGIGFVAKDVLVGIAASGRTPYVLGAMDHARSLGATAIGLTNCRDSELARHADICIAPHTGPEVITGSTRMKSGTAQKMVLNMLSTASMIKLGKVYGNLMVDVQATNEKLVERAVSIVCTATGADTKKARETLVLSGFSCKHAIVMILLDVDMEGAKAALEKAQGHISRAIDHSLATR